MKKLMTVVVIALFASTTFAQEKKMDAKPETMPKVKAAKAEIEHKMAHECYMMKEGSLMHCMGEKSDAQKEDVSLKNGTVVTPTGEVKMKDGHKTKLENGQCISMMGSIGDCDKMHEMMKMHEGKTEEHHEMKMEEKKTK